MRFTARAAPTIRKIEFARKHGVRFKLSQEEEKYFNGSQAAEFLGVKSATLYAYASRGMIESVPAQSGRERAYRLSDLIKLRQSSRGFKSQKDTDGPTWTGPVIKSAITEIRADGHRYRGQSALALAAKGQAFEQIAELLWETEGSELEWKSTRPIALPKHLKTLASAEVDYLDLLKVLIASAEISDPVTRKLLSDDIFGTARRLIVTMSITPGLGENRDQFVSDGPYPVAQTLLSALCGVKSKEKSEIINSALVLCADHELNASALAARIAASCDASLYSSLLSALGTFSGSLHGLASQRAEDTVHNSLKFKSTSAWLKEFLKHSERIPGFGTELYENGDPRAKFMIHAARPYASKHQQLKRLLEIVDCVSEQLDLKPNLDIGLAAITYALSLPPGSGSTIFAVSRTAGWIAHSIEQRTYGGIIRPRARYIGKL